MGAISSAFNSAFNVIGDVSKVLAAAIGPVLEAQITAQVADAAAGGEVFDLHCDVSRSESAAVTTSIYYERRAPHAITITDLRASVTGATTTGNITVDILINGSSILTSPVQIDATKLTSVGSGTPFAINPADLIINDNDLIKVAVTGQGDGTATGLKVDIIGLGTTVGQLAMPTYITNGGFNSAIAPTTTLTVPWPGGILNNDIALLWVDARGPGSITTPGGWTAAGISITQGNITARLYWYRCNGTESGNVSIVYSGSRADGVISLWRNCVQLGSPIEALTPNSNTGVTMSGQTVVTAGPNRRVVTLYWHADADATTPNPGWTNTFDLDFGGFNQISAACSTFPAFVGASVGPDSRVLGSSQDWVTEAFALVPGT